MVSVHAADQTLAKLRDRSPLIRQWQLLEWLCSRPEGVTLSQAAEAAGVDIKTIRRDIAMLRKVGFDVKHTVGRGGLRRWRVVRPFEKMRSKGHR